MKTKISFPRFLCMIGFATILLLMLTSCQRETLGEKAKVPASFQNLVTSPDVTFNVATRLLLVADSVPTWKGCKVEQVPVMHLKTDNVTYNDRLVCQELAGYYYLYQGTLIAQMEDSKEQSILPIEFLSPHELTAQDLMRTDLGTFISVRTTKELQIESMSTTSLGNPVFIVATN